ncbi:YgaP family membrane protein [Kaarinaea lacus]
MKKGPNMHPIDRVVRLIVGLSCVYIGFIDLSLISSRPVAIVVGIFGVINLWAFTTTRCPVYSAAGFSTADKTEESTGI